ncbi:MAG: EpsG family protein [Paludibacteraceae bacterium]
MTFFVFAEFIFSKNDRICRQIYNLAFFVLVFMVGIRYYYGPDIAHYVPFYNDLPNVWLVLTRQYASGFEYGFDVFCSAVKSCGFSFWWCTLFITLIYYSAIWILFKKLTKFRTFALFALILLDYNLPLHELRQCLSVSFFIFAYLLYQKRKHLGCLVCAIICGLMHKSGFIICACTILFMLFWHTRIDKRAYITLAILLCAMLIIPLSNIGETIFTKLTISRSINESILHHLQLGKNLQTIFPIYFLGILCLAYYSNFTANDKHSHWMMWICIAVIVFVYQYWYLLNRLRSFFLPFIIVYMQREIAESKITDAIPRQIFATIFMLYAIVFNYNNNIRADYAQSHTFDTVTIFDLINNDTELLQKHQLEEASLYWNHDIDFAMERTK